MKRTLFPARMIMPLHETEVHDEGSISGIQPAVDADGKPTGRIRVTSIGHGLHSGDRVFVGRTLMIYTGQDESATCNVADVVDIVPGATAEDPAQRAEPTQAPAAHLGPPGSLARLIEIRRQMPLKGHARRGFGGAPLVGTPGFATDAALGSSA